MIAKAKSQQMFEQLPAILCHGKKNRECLRNGLNCDHLKMWSFGQRLNPSPTTNFRLFKKERFCRRKSDINSGKFSTWVENNVGKREIVMSNTTQN